ncbi:hypothetical protein [Aliikangiella sp. IMCC44359]|uniref:hypothetical protein n=1 Tax=Aliikangiella sp. IMCC44359 TaxID=3459125 RepID=UPI00403B2D90
MSVLYWIIGICIIAALGGYGLFRWLVHIHTYPYEVSKQKVKNMKDFEVLDAGVSLAELPNSLETIPSEFRSEDTKYFDGKAFVINPEGLLEVYDPFEHYVDIDKYWGLTNEELKYNIVLNDGKVFQIDEQKLGNILHEFNNPSIGKFNYIAAINEEYFLLGSEFRYDTSNKSFLWQVNKNNYEIIKLTDEPHIELSHYPYDRYPFVYRGKKFAGTIVVYYTGSLSFAPGGDSIRPEYSVVRIYNDNHPKGKDLVKLSLAAGVITNIEVDEREILILTDPNLPSNSSEPAEPETTLRTWKLKID